MHFINLTRERIRTAGRGLGVVALAAGLTVFPSMAFASSQVVVTPTNTQGWTTAAPTASNTPDSSINFVSDSTAPGSPSNGAIELTTANNTSSQAQYMLPVGVAFSGITELSYQTKQDADSLSPSIADPSYQLGMCAGGIGGNSCHDFTTLVYEPYENGTVTSGSWQSWNLMSGQLWSSHTVSDGNCQMTKSQGEFTYTVAQVQSMCPNAYVFQTGVNIGSNNPGYDVEADLFDFNGTTYNFEPFAAVTDANACKNGGWMTQVDNNNHGFKNQGACVSYVQSSGQSNHQTY